MCGSIYSEEIISEFTLALLEDLGYYKQIIILVD